MHPPTAEQAADELYRLPPDAFVPRRDELAELARQAGLPEEAKAIARLRRPTQAAWLSNLLTRERATQLRALLDLARELAAAQRSLDGPTLRQLSGQRSQLIAAMAAEARRLAIMGGHPVADATERELRGILEAAMADAAIAEEVRSGRLTRTVRHAGFGPAATESAFPQVDGAAAGTVDAAEATRTDGQRTAELHRQAADAQERAAHKAREREAEELAARRRERAEARHAAEQAAAEARRAVQLAQDRHEDATAERERTNADVEAAERRVQELTIELDLARTVKTEANEAARVAAQTEREAARAERDARTELTRAEVALAELAEPD